MFKSESITQETSTVPTLAYLALGLGVLILGTSAMMIAFADAPGPVSGFYRMGIGWLVLTTATFIQKKPASDTPNTDKDAAAGLRWGALAGLFFGLDLVFWTTGILVAGPTKITLLGNTSPLWVGLGTMLIFKERHGLKFWLGLGLALLGMVLVVMPEISSGIDWSGSSLYGLASGLFYGAFFLAAQHGRKLINPLTFVRTSTMVSALVLLTTALILHQPLWGYSMETYGWFLGMGFIVQGLGWFSITYAQGHLPAAIVSPTLLGQPVLTALFSAWLLDERFTPIEAIGGAAVLLGVLLVHLKRK